MTELPGRKRIRPEDDHIIIEDELQEQHPAQHNAHTVETKQEYIKFAGVIIAIIIVSLGLTTLRGGWTDSRFPNDFMAVFFMTFASFKFINLEEFVATYRTYDLLSMRIRPWAYALPFIEAFLGLSYFVSTDAWQIDFLTLAVTGTAGYSVYKALNQKTKFHCACLGSFIKLPLTKVSLVENGTMFVMAFLMLLT